MTTVKTFATLLSAAALLAATSASALTVSTGVAGSVRVGAPSSTIDVSANTSDSAQGNTSDNANDANVTANTNTGLSVPLVITRADIGAIATTDVAVSNVRSKTDLSAYIATNMRTDANIYAVDTASDHVAVTYPEHAQLFDFIPVTVETTATTDASGNVSITQPWWSFLAAADNEMLQSNVQINVSGVLGANASSNTELSVSQQARLVMAIQAAMAATYNASTSANVSSS